MTLGRPRRLTLVPPTVEDLHGQPCFGTYRGELDEVALWRLRGPYGLPFPLRVLKHKRWSYLQVVTPELVVAMAVVDAGYSSNAFLTALDLRTRLPIFDGSFLGLPGTRAKVNDRPGGGLCAYFRRPGADFSLERGRRADRYRVEVKLRSWLPLLGEQVRWSGDAVTLGAAPALTVISPVAGDGLVNVTQKRAAMLALGTLRVGHRTWSLDGGVAGMDYSQGYLARKTAWRWAMGNGRLEDGTALGFNLVEGFNEESRHCNENALWVGDELFPLERARFTFDRRAPGSPWEVETVDGAAKLRFEPLHLHREDLDLKLVKSRFLQPLGLFSGTFKVAGRTLHVRDLGGVTEDQDILW